MSLPRGFHPSGAGFSCDNASPAYVRGILLPTTTYNAMSQDERFALMDPNVYPRWRLYGGPFNLKQDADAWDQYLYFWAFQNGQTWVSHFTQCIAPDWAVQWPPDRSLRWDWIYETSRPLVASRVYDPNTGRNEIRWA